MTRGWTVFEREKKWILKYKSGTSWRQHRLPDGLLGKREATQAAESWLAERIVAGDVEPKRNKSSGGMTVEEVAKKWIALRKANERLAPATIKDNESHLDKHIKPAFGPTPVVALDVPELRAWLRGLRSRVAAFTCRNIASTFRTMLDEAKDERWVKMSINPMRDSGVTKELPEGRTRAGHTKLVIPPEHAQALIDDERIHAARRLRYLLAFSTGLRDGEIAGLTWTHVDLEADVPHVRVKEALRLYGDEGKVTRGELKTYGSDRVVPFTEALTGALRWWWAEGWESAVGKPISIDAPLLPCVLGRYRGRASRPDSPALVREDLVRLGLPDKIDGHALTFHATRRSFATWLAAAGVPGDVRTMLLGHEGGSTDARHYTAAVLRRLRQAVDGVPLGWGLVRPLVRDLVRPAPNTSNLSSHLGDLNPRPAVYETTFYPNNVVRDEVTGAEKPSGRRYGIG